MSDRRLIIDCETRSLVDITVRGAYVYAEDPSTDVLLASWLWTDQPTVVHRWRRGEPCPAEIAEHVHRDGEIIAHNASFERLIWRNCWAPKHGWPEPRLEQWRCTATTAAAMALPRSLGALGAALSLPVKKDTEGKHLIKIHSCPAFVGPDGPVWHALADDPASLERFHEYCDDDVRTTYEAWLRLMPLSAREQEIYHLNERINDRGLRIDVTSAKAAMRLTNVEKGRLNERLRKLTDGAVEGVTKAADMKAWLAGRGVEMESLDKLHIEEALFEIEDMPGGVREVLEIRALGAKPSVDKIASMLAHCCADGRVRGAFLQHGAGVTGRFSSRGCQLHNMPRPRKVFENEAPRLDLLFDTIRSGDPEMLTTVYGPELGAPMHMLSDAVRSFIWAAPGHEILDADFSSIEGRFAAWISREEWKVEAYRALDRGDPDAAGLYEATAAGIFNVHPKEVTKPQRQAGKVAELALGYQGSIGALSRMARDNRMKLAPVFPIVWAAATQERRDRAEARRDERYKKKDALARSLSREEYLAASLIVDGWRASNKEIVQSWYDLRDAAMAAVARPGEIVKTLYGKVAFVVRRHFLWMLLPSGRALAYGMAKIEEVEAPWADKSLPKRERETIETVTVLGVTDRGVFVRYGLSGGALYNNLVQGSCRDLLCNGMLNADQAGLDIIAHIHDEIVVEQPAGAFDVEAFERLICDLPPWAEGLPLVADGWADKRFHK